MDSTVGESTLDEVEAGELPGPVELDDLTPVEDVTRQLRGLFRGFPKFDDTYLVGEVSDLSEHGENLYFTLTAAHAEVELQCVVWGSRRDDLGVTVEPEMVVAVSGELTFFEGGGRPSLEASKAHSVGESAYWQRVERLRTELDDDGLFDPERKDSLPRFPDTVGVVTAAGSDAERDIAESIHGRYPAVDILVHDATVQGSAAPGELTTAVGAVDESAADVLVVARGGGSDTSLRTFDDESVVRAIAAAETPTVTAIGHEADQPLCDEVADERVKTPTAAGEAVVPDREAYLDVVDESVESVRAAYEMQVYRWLGDRRAEIDRAYRDLAVQWLGDRRTAVDGAQTRLVEEWLASAERDVESAYARLASEWVEANRTAIDRETERIERERAFQREKSGLERRTTVLYVLVAVLVGLLLVALALLLGVV
jgi:exodeoxyribonuclease VII large subunit